MIEKIEEIIHMLFSVGLITESERDKKLERVAIQFENDKLHVAVSDEKITV